MADTNRNIFSLSEYSDDTIAGEGISVDSVYVSPPYGVASSYIAGGMMFTPGPNTTTYYSIVDKLQFSSDSVARSPSADLDIGGHSKNPVASSTAAYWMSGNAASGSTWTSKTSKTTFSTDTTASSPNYPSSPGLGWNYLGATATETTGYIGGGSRTPGVTTTHLQKLDFSTDAFSNAPRFPQHQKNTGDALGNQTHGYWSGGTQTPYPGPNTNSVNSIIARFTYSTETHSNVGNLPAPRKLVAASGNATEGYIYGGTEGHPSSIWVRSTIIKLTYSTDTTSLNPSNLTGTSQYPATGGRASGNLSNGYVTSAGDPATNSNIFKFDYSTGTASNPGSLKRSISAAYAANASARSYGHPGKFPAERWTDGADVTPNNGYAIAGGSPTVSNTDRLNMSTDSVERMPGMGSYNNTWMVGTTMASSLNKGYYGGEYAGGKSSIWNIVYATDGREHNPSLNLAEGLAYFNSAGNVNKGYVLGGYIAYPAPNRTLSRVSRMTYSTDSTSTIPGANIPAAPTPNFATGEGSAAFSSSGDESGAAYLTGGKEWPSQGNRSYIWKMSYATETTTLLPARVPNTRTSAAAHSEKSAGYLTGGWIGPAGVTSVLKFPWSTETFLEDGGDGMHRVGASTGNQQAAYVMGGISNTTGSGTLAIKKFEYSTSTSSQISASLTGSGNRQGAWGTGALTNNLPSVPDAPTATPTPTTVNVPNPSLSTEGYWSGGSFGGGNPGMRSITDRLTFATDTTSRLPGSNCPSVKHFASGSSSATKGYSNGGYEGWESPRTSNIYSLTYASGTWATAATLGETRGKTASVNNLLYSWTGGGGNSDPATYTSKIDRLTFATETPSKNVLQSANPFQFATGIGNNLAGYYTNPKIDTQGGTTIVEKLTYSTDSIALTPGLHVSGTTSLGSRVIGTMSFGTGDIGYVMGGNSPNRSTVNKITFATDTRTVGTNLWAAVGNGSGLSSPSAGYLTGTNPGTTSDAYKMPFASETWTYTGPANASPSSGSQKTGFGAGMNGNAFPEITPIL